MEGDIMAIKFDKQAFQEHIKKTIDTKQNESDNDNIQEQNDEAVVKTDSLNLNVTKTNYPVDDTEIRKKELKKRYNLSLRPSINRKLLIESSKRGLNKSQLVEQLVENAFGKEQE